MSKDLQFSNQLTLGNITTEQRFSLVSWFYTISMCSGKIALAFSLPIKKVNLQLEYLVLRKHGFPG